jgi:hypothetical protein
MSLKNAAFLALVGMCLLTILVLFGFIRDVSSAADGLIPAVRVVSSLIYLLASLGVTIFFFVFFKGQS